MKKTVNVALFYAIVAMVGGVFYREFTKIIGFTGRTTLSFVHTHLFMLGMMFFLLVLILDYQFGLSNRKEYKRFFIVYNVGLITAVTMLVVRGVAQAQMLVLSRGMDAAISGIAGLGHILLGVGMVFFLLMLKKAVAQKSV